MSFLLVIQLFSMYEVTDIVQYNVHIDQLHQLNSTQMSRMVQVVCWFRMTLQLRRIHWSS